MQRARHHGSRRCSIRRQRFAGVQPGGDPVGLGGGAVGGGVAGEVARHRHEYGVGQLGSSGAEFQVQLHPGLVHLIAVEFAVLAQQGLGQRRQQGRFGEVLEGVAEGGGGGLLDALTLVGQRQQAV